MNLFASFNLAISRIMATKTRSILTMLGIVIGVASLVALMSVAQGATSGISNALSGLGAKQITVSGTSATGLVEDDVTALSTLPSVESTYSQVSGQGTASTGKVDVSLSLIGVSPNYLSMALPKIAVGSFLPTSLPMQESRDVVLSAVAANDLNIKVAQIGQIIYINGQPFQLVGVLNDANGFGARGIAYITQDAARKIFAQTPYVSSITLQSTTETDVAAVATEADALLRGRYGLNATDSAQFMVTSQTSLLSTLSTVQNTLKLMLGGIASISLIVGGIGIMNIMLVSVRERTREIGVRRAIGARQRQILVQFLIEAVVLSVLGGLIGLMIGELLAYVIAQKGGWAFTVSPGTVGLALGFSALVGILFGVVPARTASRLQPVEALRFE
ncbi:MAG: ABC transporter permease [Actinomycetes bacterium]